MIRLSTVYSRKRNKKRRAVIRGKWANIPVLFLSFSLSIVSLSLSHIDRSSSPAVLGTLLGETERFDPYVPFYFFAREVQCFFVSKMSHVRFPDRKPIVCYSPRPKSAQVYIVRLEKIIGKRLCVRTMKIRNVQHTERRRVTHKCRWHLSIDALTFLLLFYLLAFSNIRSFHRTALSYLDSQNREREK